MFKYFLGTKAAHCLLSSLYLFTLKSNLSSVFLSGAVTISVVKRISVAQSLPIYLLNKVLVFHFQIHVLYHLKLSFFLS